MLKYCILCVVFIKLVFGCWGSNYPSYYYYAATTPNTSMNYTDDGNMYGSYAGYFYHSNIYNLYGEDGKGSGKYGPGGKNNMSSADENALLPANPVGLWERQHCRLVRLDSPVGTKTEKRSKSNTKVNLYHFFLRPPGEMSNDALVDLFKAKWLKWTADYYKKKELEKNASGILTSKERDEQNDPFWPTNLFGAGKGLEGDPPPPYAYKSMNDEGYPALCYQRIHKGRYGGIKCKPGPRYAFVSGINICVAFYFRGCGENQNNFKTKKKCEEACTKIPKSGCDPNTMQNFNGLGYEIMN